MGACFLLATAVGADSPKDTPKVPHPLDTKSKKEVTVEELQAYHKAAAEGRALPPKKLKAASAANHGAATQALIAGIGIRYDTGSGSLSPVPAVTSGRMVGNRFVLSDATSLPQLGATIAVTRVTFDLDRTSFNQASVSLYEGAGASPDQVLALSVPAMVGFNTVALTSSNTVMSGSFLAGIWVLNTSFTRLVFDTGTFNGLGFNAVSINEPDTMSAPMGRSLNNTLTNGGMNINAVFRVQVQADLPVELIDFEVK